MFCVSTLKALSGADKHTLPIFHNLTDLELSFNGEAVRAAWSFLPKVLASSLVLVKLVLPHVSCSS